MRTLTALYPVRRVISVKRFYHLKINIRLVMGFILVVLLALVIGMVSVFTSIVRITWANDFTEIH